MEPIPELASISGLSGFVLDFRSLRKRRRKEAIVAEKGEMLTIEGDENRPPSLTFFPCLPTREPATNERAIMKIIQLEEERGDGSRQRQPREERNL